MNYAALKTELASSTYNGMTDAQILTAINAKTVAAPKKALLRPTDIINAIAPSDFATLTTVQVGMLTLLLAGETVDGSAGTTVRLGVQTIFAGKTTTLANLGALVAPYDNATGSWVLANLGVPTLTQPDLDAVRTT